MAASAPLIAPAPSPQAADDRRDNESEHKLDREHYAPGMGSLLPLTSQRRMLARLTLGLPGGASLAFGKKEEPPSNARRTVSYGTAGANRVRAVTASRAFLLEPASPLCTPGATPCCVRRCIFMQSDVHRCVEV